jgi:hypothetical protein
MRRHRRRSLFVTCMRGARSRVWACIKVSLIGPWPI